jgi:sulfotransferase family protein
MKLIGAGLPRTGTLSRTVAFEMLGLAPSCHVVNVLAGMDEAHVWRRALDGGGRWQELFGGFPAAVDWPGSFFYRELTEFYPDAKGAAECAMPMPGSAACARPSGASSAATC